MRWVPTPIHCLCTVAGDDDDDDDMQNIPRSDRGTSEQKNVSRVGRGQILRKGKSTNTSSGDKVKKLAKKKGAASTAGSDADENDGKAKAKYKPKCKAKKGSDDDVMDFFKKPKSTSKKMKKVDDDVWISTMTSPET
ncbi:hypothetical protein BYT27DRAFT_7206901 [Phlegmacium glaucopus]|nr:hypothetical protein BYT27DRAFT_7206901 [Phlegmacium glaucopus]